MEMRFIECAQLTTRLAKTLMVDFKAKLHKDKITGTHFVVALISAYVNGDIHVVGRPANMRRGRLFQYKEHEEANDVLGVKFATSNENVLINPSKIVIEEAAKEPKKGGSKTKK